MCTVCNSDSDVYSVPMSMPMYSNSDSDVYSVMTSVRLLCKHFNYKL